MGGLRYTYSPLAKFCLDEDNYVIGNQNGFGIALVGCQDDIIE